MIDATEIAPCLYQGGKPPLGLACARAGFQALVLCARELQPPPDFFSGIAVFHAPNEDAPREPTRAELILALQAARWAALRAASGAPVLVTCAVGRNRSGLVTALALHLLTGKRGAECVEHVQRRRRGALRNEGFVRALCALLPPPPAGDGPTMIAGPGSTKLGPFPARAYT